MAKIRNSSVDNAYGGGKQQIFTDDNGKEYIIKNSSLDNVYGSGKQEIIEEKGSSEGGLADWLTDVVPWWGWIIFFGVLFIVQRIIAA